MVGYLEMSFRMASGPNHVFWYQVLREHILFAKISYATFGLLMVLLLQFVSLLMMSKQSNYYYEEMLRYFSYLERLIKRRQRND